MKCWFCKGFKGHYPVGTAAVVVAHDEEEAVYLINEQLRAHGLTTEVTADKLQRVSLGSARAVILCDGNY